MPGSRDLSGINGQTRELPRVDRMELHDVVLSSHTSDVAARELEQSVDRFEARTSNRSERHCLALYL
jgi:hypothetical protein